MGLGGETGLYSPVFENALLLAQGKMVWTTEIAPTVTMTVDMQAGWPQATPPPPQSYTWTRISPARDRTTQLLGLSAPPKHRDSLALFRGVRL